MQMKGDLNPTLYLSHWLHVVSKKILVNIFWGYMCVFLPFLVLHILSSPTTPEAEEDWLLGEAIAGAPETAFACECSASIFCRSHSLRDHHMRHFTSFYLIIVVVSRFFNGRFEKKWAKQVRELGFCSKCSVNPPPYWDAHDSKWIISTLYK